MFKRVFWELCFRILPLSFIYVCVYIYVCVFCKYAFIYFIYLSLRVCVYSTNMFIFFFHASFIGVLSESFADVLHSPPRVLSLCFITRHGQHFCAPCTVYCTPPRRPSSKKSYWWMTPAWQVGPALSVHALKINYL